MSPVVPLTWGSLWRFVCVGNYTPAISKQGGETKWQARGEQTAGETRSGEVSSSRKSLLRVGARVKTWVADGAIARAADWGFQRSQPQRSSGFYNGSVQPGYLRALECEKNGKTDTRARTERPCIQHLHELAIKSQQISTHMWQPPDTAALTWSQFMGTKHILLAGIITRSCDLTTNYRWKTWLILSCFMLPLCVLPTTQQQQTLSWPENTT